MPESRENLTEAETEDLRLVDKKHTVTLLNEDPDLTAFNLLAEKGLIKRLTSLDHPNSVAVTFIKIE